MPSWAPESWNDSVVCARRTARERRSPVRACASTVLFSSAVSENSAATNTAVPRVSSTNPAIAPTVSAMVIAAPTDPGPGRRATVRHIWRVRRAPAYLPVAGHRGGASSVIIAGDRPLSADRTAVGPDAARHPGRQAAAVRSDRHLFAALGPQHVELVAGRGVDAL